MSIYNELRGHPCIYTLESSFCGNDEGPFARYHFSTDNLMQTGIDLCRAVLIHQSIPCPSSILDGLLRNINGLYDHYKVINDGLKEFDRDSDIELMKQYDEKLKQLQKEGVPISTKWIKKALANVLRQHADVITDGESTSDMGSDKAPSEDNLNPEQIA